MARAQQSEVETERNHPLADVEEIRVELDDILSAMRKNREHARHERGRYVLRISPSWGSFDEIEEAELHYKNPSRYKLEGPSPVDIRPATFLLGHSLARMVEVDSIAIYPRESDDKYEYENHAREDTSWEEWREQTLKMWRDEATHRIKNTDEIEFVPRDPNAANTSIAVTLIDDE